MKTEPSLAIGKVAQDPCEIARVSLRIDRCLVSQQRHRFFAGCQGILIAAKIAQTPGKRAEASRQIP